ALTTRGEPVPMEWWRGEEDPTSTAQAYPMFFGTFQHVTANRPQGKVDQEIELTFDHTLPNAPGPGKVGKVRLVRVDTVCRWSNAALAQLPADSPERQALEATQVAPFSMSGWEQLSK